jgi:thiol-disulfide isomerase/thioredoxin
MAGSARWKNMRFLTILLLAFQLSQVRPPDPPAVDALALLTEVGQRYADAKSYHIEAVQERTSSNDLSRSWQKSLLSAVAAPGGRYRYEGRSNLGTAVLVSDGTTQWNYHSEAHQYTQQPAMRTPESHRVILQGETAAEDAKYLADRIIHLAKGLKSATLLPEETISMNGHTVECYVIRYRGEDRKTRRLDYQQEETVWIEKSHKVVVKTYRRDETYLLTDSSIRVPIIVETTVVYPVVQLDEQQPASTFAFVAPANAKLVAEFRSRFDARGAQQATELLGEPAAELHLKSASGDVTTLSSLRGKPVFIEFWATWCRPCVDLMPALAKLYGETADRGLVWFSVDNDEDPGDATAFINREHIPWHNYHDEDGSLGEAFHRGGIPLGVLIDAEGKVTFCTTGYEIAELRNAIAKLGPGFSAVATSK